MPQERTGLRNIRRDETVSLEAFLAYIIHYKEFNINEEFGNWLVPGESSNHIYSHFINLFNLLKNTKPDSPLELPVAVRDVIPVTRYDDVEIVKDEL